MADTYAIVESGGKQYRAEKGTTLVVDRIAADEGAKVNLRAVMYRGDDETVIAGDKLERVKVEATVAGHERGAKIRVFKYRPKKGYRKRAGHRSELTRLEVTDVKMLTRKPAAKPAAKPAEKADEAPKKAPARKTAARSTAAKKPAAKRPAAKKPAARKPAARKTSTTQKKES
jgi:large subunit ribosomal protein L21